MIDSEQIVRVFTFHWVVKAVIVAHFILSLLTLGVVLRAGHARLACAETSSVGKDVGPRTHRSDLGDGRLSAVGIPVL